MEPEIAGVPGLTDANDLPVLGTLIAAQQGARVSVLITSEKAPLALTDRYPIRTPAELGASHGGV